MNNSTKYNWNEKLFNKWVITRLSQSINIKSTVDRLYNNLVRLMDEDKEIVNEYKTVILGKNKKNISQWF